jgi:hypothetical protein
MFYSGINELTIFSRSNPPKIFVALILDAEFPTREEGLDELDAP